jgi:hypothetical protein
MTREENDMKERLQMLEEIIEEMEIVDETLYDALLKVDEINIEDFRLSSRISRISLKIQDIRDIVQELIEDAMIEVEQYD